jgi:hypothetical protein
MVSGEIGYSASRPDNSRNAPTCRLVQDMHNIPKLSNFNIIFTQMKQQTNNPQSTTAQALTSFPENPQLYIFAYTITGILCIS